MKSVNRARSITSYKNNYRVSSLQEIWDVRVYVNGIFISRCNSHLGSNIHGVTVSSVSEISVRGDIVSRDAQLTHVL
jgi:hypothetical protein